jgi:uncharacterized protein (DUF1501 family)
LRVAAGAGFLNFAGSMAMAQSGSRILVGVYLLGGNDGNNLVIPVDQYAKYVAGRGMLAISAADLLQATGDGSAHLQFHPAVPQIRDLFDSGSLAIAANIGSQTQNSTHSENPDFDYFTPGYITSKWAAGIAGASSPHPNSNVADGFPTPFPSAAGSQTTALTLTGPGADAAKTTLFGQVTNAKLQFATPFPSSALGAQLLQVARILRSGGSAGASHFFAIQSGYDTHTDQLRRQQTLFSELGAALYAFHAATIEMGISREVTVYTDSDFGRTLRPNASGGSQHGWGNHQIVLGGSVLGGRVYGSFPDLTPSGASDANGAGVWIPQQTKAQYSASLAAWAGVSQPVLRQFLPELGVFPAPDLAFMN